MELQTLLIWGARLACPVAMGLMLWWMLRGKQSDQRQEQTPVQQFNALQRRRIALDAEIQALEDQASSSETEDASAMHNVDKPPR